MDDGNQLSNTTPNEDTPQATQYSESNPVRIVQINQQTLKKIETIAEKIDRQSKSIDTINGLVYFGFVVIVLMTGAMVIAYIQQISQTNTQINQTLNQLTQEIDKR